MLDVNEMFQIGLKQVRAAGIKPGKINPEIVISNAKSQFGLCRKEKNGRYEYIIEINNKLLFGEKEHLMDTIVHEILHSVEGCMNHGPNWKNVVKIVNDKYGYKIKRCSSYEEKGLEHEEGKYILECEKCCKRYHREKAVSLVKNPERFSCGKCSGPLKLVKGKELLKERLSKAAKPKNEKGYKYTITCQGCKASFNRKVMSNVIKNISQYRCSCGHKKLIVKQNF